MHILRADARTVMKGPHGFHPEVQHEVASTLSRHSGRICAAADGGGACASAGLCDRFQVDITKVANDPVKGNYVVPKGTYGIQEIGGTTVKIKQMTEVLYLKDSGIWINQTMAQTVTYGKGLWSTGEHTNLQGGGKQYKTRVTVVVTVSNPGEADKDETSEYDQEFAF